MRTQHVRKYDNKIISSNFIINIDLRNREMSISFNQLNGTDVSDGRGNTTLGTLSSQGGDGQRGLNNTAVGFGALRTNGSSVQHNTAIGLNALSYNAGSDNVAIGENALYNYLTPTVAQTGNYNVAVGNNAIQCNTSGYQNVAMGNQALNNNTTGYLNVAIGNNAMEGTDPTSATGSYNVAIGNQALNNNISGSDNAVVGNAAGYFNTTGKNNAALGANALLNNTTGTQNVAIGKDALKSAQVAIGNVAVGHHALKNNATGNGNIGIGNHALTASTIGSNNVGIGSGVSSNGKDSCILLGNGAQTVVSNEIGIGGINLAAPPSPAPSITGYLPVRMSNSTLSNKLYYVPMYDPAVTQTLPIPEVIIANSSSAGVGLLIGFPSGYSAATSVTIVNGACTVVINSPISTSGYYVYYERANTGGFWDSLSPSTFSNLVSVSGPTPQSDSPTLCGGLVFGDTLTFTYVLAATPTTVTYQPKPPSLNITDGYQYQQYNGASATNGEFQWGRNPGGGGSQLWGTQTGSGTQTYSAWTSSGDYQFNSIYKYLYPYSTVSGPPGPTSVSMTWLVTKTLSSITNGATYTIGGTGSTDIQAPTITGATGTAPTITYSISSDSNMPSITLTGSTLAFVWDAWSTSVSSGLSTNAIITATIQGTSTSAYLTTLLTVGSNNTLTCTITPYTQLSAPTLYAIPAALTFSAQAPYYINTPFTVSTTTQNVVITSNGSSSAGTSNGVTTITPQTAGSTIITATSSTGKRRTLLTIDTPPSSGVVLLYSQVANMAPSSNLSIAPSALQQFIANQSGTDEVSGIIDYFFIPLITFTASVPSTTNISFEMTLAKNGTTLVTTTFTLPGDAGAKYPNGINIPFLSQSTASNKPVINSISPASADTTITNFDTITITLKPVSTQTGNWQINVVGGEMAGKVYGISQTPIDRTVPTFTPVSLTFADVVYTSGLTIPFTLTSNSNGTITHTVSSDVATISEVANSGGGPTSYRVNVSKPGTATITFTQAASGRFSFKTITATLNVLTAPTITFTPVVNVQMTYAIGVKPVVLNTAQSPAATSTNTNVPIKYELTGVSNIAGGTSPCATITTTGTGESILYTLTLYGVGSSSPSFTLVASQVATTTHGASRATLSITIVPGDGPSNRIVLNTITSNPSTAPFEMDLFSNSANTVSMSYKTTLNAVVTYFNIPKFNVDTNGASKDVSFTLTVFRGQEGSIPSILVAITNFTITTNASGVYNPVGGITVPLSPPGTDVGAPGYMPTTAGVSGVTTSQAGQLQLYAIQIPSTPYSISTTTPNILIVLAPSTNINYGSVTVDVNTNNPSGMLGTLYGYIQLLSPILTFTPILTPITWGAGKTVSFTQATSSATDLSLLTYSSSNTNIATIPVSTTNVMTLSTTQPTTPTNVITITASRAATAIYSLQTVTMNPTTTPPYPICIKTYALDITKQKMAFTNPKSSSNGTIPAGSPVYITFIAPESFKTLDSLNFAINGGQYGYTNAPTTPIFTINMTTSGSTTTSTSIVITMKSTQTSYDSNVDGTLREIPFAALDNYPTSIQSFSCTGNSNPPCYTGDTISISMSCNVPWYINSDAQQNIVTTIVGTTNVAPSSLFSPVPKILYMTSSDSTILSTTAANSNSFLIFKKAVITSFQITGVRPQGQTQQFTLAAEQRIYSSAGNYNSYNTLTISFTYNFGTSYDSTFASIKVPFSYTEYSRLYPTSYPMTAFSIYVSSNLPAQSVPTPFLVNINDTFMCTLTYVSVGNFAVNTLGNIMSGSVYGYEILDNPNLGALTVSTPINYLSNNPGRIITITPPSSKSSSLTFIYTVSSIFTVGTGANSNTITISTPGYKRSITITATSSETNQYISSSVNQYVDVVMRTQMPSNLGAIMNLNPSTAISTATFVATTYANVFKYYTNSPVVLYGFGFFEFTAVPNVYSFTKDGTSQSDSPTFTFVINRYTGNWITQRTITFTYKGNMNSRDDGSMFIVPFYNLFSSTATNNQLPFGTMPSNITNLTVVDNAGTNVDVNSPPSYNPGDILMLQMSCYNANGTPNRGAVFPIDQYGQLSGTLLTDYNNVLNPISLNSVIFYSYNNIGSPGQTQFTSTTFQNYVYHMVVTGIMIAPIIGVPINTTFQINFYVNGSVYFNIQATTTIDEAFGVNTNPGTYLFFGGMPTTNTYQGTYANRFVITSFNTNTNVTGSYINHGLGGYNATAFTANPWIAANTPIFFTINFTGLAGQNKTLTPWWAAPNGSQTGNIPGIFLGNNTPN